MSTSNQSTPTRPQMTKEQAALYRPDIVLSHDTASEEGEPWDPIAPALASLPRKAKPDYRVDPTDLSSANCFASIQRAINKAVVDAKTKKITDRLVIEIAPGTYNELVYVPSLEVDGKKVPLTLIGRETDATKTVISVNIDQGLTADAYTMRFSSAFLELDDSIRSMFEAVSARGDFDIGTTNSCVMRVCNDGFEAVNLTIENSYNEDRLTPDVADLPADERPLNEKGQLAYGQHQAVAVLIDAADRVYFENVRLLGDQDTIYFKTNEPRETVKSYYKDCHIEGDVDFIFGNSTAYFDHCRICSKGARTPNTYVAAPSTNIHIPYGIVFWDCDFIHDDSEAALAGRFHLGRQWFERVRATPYGSSPVPGYNCKLGDLSHYEEPVGTIALKTLEAVGKVAVLHSRIGDHINPAAPWTDWNGGEFDRDGNYLPAPWAPRFRPVQYDLDDFTRYLEDWLAKEGLDYSTLDKTLPFIGEYGNSDNGEN
ncbi:pectinesterase family protein [uncultured Cohaesibacter sp.]|uniref:pectinesterase family protein n=1 Tax=uncultured Cohaesibacter sp. TaxID=1002546 RepID=UPI00292F2E0B|nr:pectinesterase family protein [uncultured Cohaesibacter sp.]